MTEGDSSFFVDTNVLLYRLGGVDRDKQARAHAWLDQLWMTGRGRISWQVLHEFYWNATRKLKTSIELAQEEVRGLALWRPIENSLGLIETAWSWAEQARLPYWDGLIVAAAERAGAAYLLSEDFQAGRQFGACTVVNPFAAEPNLTR